MERMVETLAEAVAVAITCRSETLHSALREARAALQIADEALIAAQVALGEVTGPTRVVIPFVAPD